MRRSHTLLRRALAQLGGDGNVVLSTESDSAVRLAARTLSSAAACLSLSTHLLPLRAGLPCCDSSSAASDLRLAPGPVRFLHGSAAAHSDDRQAAVRRLAVARARREKQAVASAPRPAADLDGADQQPAEQQQPTDGALATAAANAITPVEGKASEAQIAAALDHPALIVTRPIEWGTVIFGYEQANKYTVYDEGGRIVALVAEDYGGFGKEVGRQLLRTRRSFTATVFSADGSQVLFRLRRPAYLISSTMFVEDGSGEVLGEIHQRWHALRRNYDLYMGKSQFAAISGTFLAWEFELKDSAGGTLALVDRNFQGFAKEIFTDAGKYVIHFGYEGQQLQQHLDTQAQAQAQQPQQQLAAGGQQAQAQQPQGETSAAPPVGPQSAAPAPAAPAAAAGGQAAAPAAGSPPPVTSMAMARTGVAVIPTVGGNQLAVARPLALSERMVALACALTIDYDFFSQHSHSGGGLMPPLIVPVPGGGTPVPADAPPGGGLPEGGSRTGDLPAAGAAGAAQGAVGDVPFGGAGGGVGGAGATGAGSAAQTGGWQDGGFDAGKSWGETGSGDGEMKWDLGGDGGGGVGGGGEEGGGVMGVLKGLWELFGGGD